MSPILRHEKTTFAYIKYSNLYIVAMTRTNANIALIFVYLYRMVQVSFYLQHRGYLIFRNLALFTITGKDKHNHRPINKLPHISKCSVQFTLIYTIH